MGSEFFLSVYINCTSIHITLISYAKGLNIVFEAFPGPRMTGFFLSYDFGPPLSLSANTYHIGSRKTKIEKREGAIVAVSAEGRGGGGIDQNKTRAKKLWVSSSLYRACICKRLRSPGIDQARNRFLGSFEGLQIRPQYYVVEQAAVLSVLN